MKCDNCSVEFYVRNLENVLLTPKYCPLCGSQSVREIPPDTVDAAANRGFESAQGFKPKKKE